MTSWRPSFSFSRAAALAAAASGSSLFLPRLPFWTIPLGGWIELAYALALLHLAPKRLVEDVSGLVGVPRVRVLVEGLGDRHLPCHPCRVKRCPPCISAFGMRRKHRPRKQGRMACGSSLRSGASAFPKAGFQILVQDPQNPCNVCQGQGMRCRSNGDCRQLFHVFYDHQVVFDKKTDAAQHRGPLVSIREGMRERN